MNIAILRVEGADHALQALSSSLELVIDSTWKQGDPKRRGGHFPNSGLSSTIADAKNPVELMSGVRQFIATCRERNAVLAGPDLSAELSLGVTVGDSQQFVACLDFSASDLLSLGALGIELSISAYPTSDEANEGCHAA